jgi:hypothetical protein
MQQATLEHFQQSFVFRNYLVHPKTEREEQRRGFVNVSC